MNKSAKKKELVIRTATYTLMSCVVVGLVSVLVLIMLGYRLDTKEGMLTQTGLVQFKTNIDGADVYVNDEKITGRTPNKTTLVEGTYNFKMEKSGFETWQKQASINSGTVTWLSYARLIPTEKTWKSSVENVSVSATLATNFGSNPYIATQNDISQPIFNIYDLRGNEVKSTALEIPEDKLSGYGEGENFTHKYQMIEWDLDSRHLLVKHSFGEENEWLILDRQDVNRVQNISKIFGVKFNSVKLYGNSGQIVYGIMDNNLYRFDLGNSSISRALATNVERFAAGKDSMMFYVGKYDDQTKTRSIGMVRDSDREALEIKKIETSADTEVRIVGGKYYDIDTVAFSVGNQVTVMSGIFPTRSDSDGMKQVRSFNVANPVTRLELSSNQRLVVAASNSEQRSYDLERNELNEPIQFNGEQPQWLDEYMLWSVDSGQLSIYDYDGLNRHSMGDVAHGKSILLTPSGKYLYAFRENQSGNINLDRMQLVP